MRRDPLQLGDHSGSSVGGVAGPNTGKAKKINPHHWGKTIWGSWFVSVHERLKEEEREYQAWWTHKGYQSRVWMSLGKRESLHWQHDAQMCICCNCYCHCYCNFTNDSLFFFLLAERLCDLLLDPLTKQTCSSSPVMSLPVQTLISTVTRRGQM